MTAIQQVSSLGRVPTMTTCTECDGEGWALYEVGRDYDGSPLEENQECKVCQGTGEVELTCPECGMQCDKLVPSAMENYRWCVACDSYEDDK